MKKNPLAEKLREKSLKARYERSVLQSMDLVFDEIRMRELYDMAVEVCLATTPDVRHVGYEDDERRLVRMLGARGLGVAVELMEGWYSQENTRNMEEEFTIEEEPTGSVFIGRDTPLRNPRLFSSSQSPEILARFEAFGNGMLQEAYLVLGTDAKPHAKALKDATTREEQLAELDWLSGRLAAMDVKDELSAGSLQQDVFYHPARLSAKGIGVYPNLLTTPTCLMKSVIASSFFEQAGYPHLHCGVMSTEYTEHQLSLARTSGYLSRSLKGYAADMVVERLDQSARANRTGFSDIGTHAVAAVMLGEGAWYICDPNYRASEVLDVTSSHYLTAAYGRLKDMEYIAPNMELAVTLERPHEMFALETIAHAARSVSIDRQGVKDILIGDDTESVMRRVYDVVAESFKVNTGDTDEGFINDAIRYFMGLSSEFEDSELPPDMHVYFEYLWDTCVLWSGKADEQADDEQTMLKRCKTDMAYLERRLDDIALLPLLCLTEVHRTLIDILIETHKENKKKGIWNEEGHYALEVGLPAYRIGSTVISDFATYFAPGEIAPSTWNGNWGSRLPITEHGYYQVDDTRYELTTDPAYAWLLSVLRYYQQDGIIAKSRERGRVNGTESNDGA